MSRTSTEVPELLLQGLLRKLAWALRQEPAPSAGGMQAYRVDRSFLDAALDLIREAAERDPEGYRRSLEPDGSSTAS